MIAGYPLSDFKATLYDGSFHTVDSNELSFKIAASMALKKGVMDCRPGLLEPIMAVEVRVPEEYMGDVNRDLNTRRGRVMGMDTLGDGLQVVQAQVPQAELFTYALSRATAHDASLKQALAANQATQRAYSAINQGESAAAAQEQQQLNVQAQDRENMAEAKQLETVGPYGGVGYPGWGGIHYHYHLYPYAY